MKTKSFVIIATLVLSLFLLDCTNNETTESHEKISAIVLSIEKTALHRWNNGDPFGFIDSYADDISYFSPGHNNRIDSIGAMNNLLAPIKGKIYIEKTQMINPRVQISGQTAILTYVLINYIKNESGRDTSYWHSTSVYKEIKGEWKVIHSHWSHPNKKGTTQDTDNILDI